MSEKNLAEGLVGGFLMGDGAESVLAPPKRTGGVAAEVEAQLRKEVAGLTGYIGIIGGLKFGHVSITMTYASVAPRKDRLGYENSLKKCHFVVTGFKPDGSMVGDKLVLEQFTRPSRRFKPLRKTTAAPAKLVATLAKYLRDLEAQ